MKRLIANNDINTILKELYNALKENKIYVDELYSYDGNIEFDINDGDWKHEHIKAKNFIYDFFNDKNINIDINETITEEDGSDTYSAHYVITLNVNKPDYNMNKISSAEDAIIRTIKNNNVQIYKFPKDGKEMMALYDGTTYSEEDVIKIIENNKCEENGIFIIYQVE